MQAESPPDIPAAFGSFVALRAGNLDKLRGLASHLDRHPARVAVLLYALIWVAFALWHSVPFASFETDGMEYIQTARSLFTAGFAYSSFHGIGYPAAIWLLHWVIPDWFLAARLVSGLAGLVMIAASASIVAELFGARAALVSAVLIITNFFVVAYAGMAMSDMLAAALAIAALWILLCFSHRVRYIAAGTLLGLAALTRYPYFGLVLTGGLIGLLEPRGRDGLRATLVYLVLFAIAAAPLLLINWSKSGNPLENANFSNLGPWFYDSPQSKDVHTWADALRLIASSPVPFVMRYLKSVTIDLPVFLGHVAGFLLFAGPAGWVIALERKEKRGKALFALGSLALYVIVAGLGFITQPRFWLYLIPFFAAGAGYLFVQLSGQNRIVSGGLIATLLVSNAAIAAVNLPRLIDSQAPEYQRAGQAIRDLAPAGARVLATQPQIALYADRPALLLRDVSPAWADLQAIVQQQGVSYVVMDDRYGAGHYPELVKLFDPVQMRSALPGWEPVYSEPGPWRIVVYRAVRQ